MDRRLNYILLIVVFCIVVALFGVIAAIAKGARGVDRENRILLFGGSTSPKSVEAFYPSHPGDNQILPDPIPKEAKFGTTGVAVGQMVILAGGQDGTGKAQKTTLIFDAYTREWPWTIGPELLEARTFAVGAALDGKFHVCGGVGVSGKVLSSCEWCKIGSTSWKNAPSLNFGRSKAAAVTFQDSIFVFGGESAFGPLASVERLSSYSEKWELVTEMPKAKSGLSAVLLGTNFIVILCASDENYCFRYEPVHDKYGAFEALNTARNPVMLANLNDEIFAFGGGVKTVERLENDRWMVTKQKIKEVRDDAYVVAI